MIIKRVYSIASTFLWVSMMLSAGSAIAAQNEARSTPRAISTASDSSGVSVGQRKASQSTVSLAKPITDAAPIFQPPKDFRLNYTIYVNWVDFRAGEATISWKTTGDRYEITGEFHTVGLASLIKKFQQVQTSRGRITPTGLVPESFTTEREGKIEESVTYDWQQGKAKFSNPSGQREFDIAAGAQDVLTLPYQLGYLIDSKQTWPQTVQVITGKRVNDYHTVLVGAAEIGSNEGAIESWHLRCVVGPDKPWTEMWINKSTHNPVSVRFYDPSKVNIRYDLVGIKPMDEPMQRSGNMPSDFNQN